MFWCLWAFIMLFGISGPFELLTCQKLRAKIQKEAICFHHEKRGNPEAVGRPRGHWGLLESLCSFKVKKRRLSSCFCSLWDGGKPQAMILIECLWAICLEPKISRFKSYPLKLCLELFPFTVLNLSFSTSSHILICDLSLLKDYGSYYI